MSRIAHPPPLPDDRTRAKHRFPVVEVFGPTIQGEGPEAGLRCWFVRLGGCDYRCSWCDTMYAVEPAQVRKAERLSATAIVGRLLELGLPDSPGAAPAWVILSGGNPALHKLGPLVASLHELGAKVAVETQGSIYRPWLDLVDRLTISPKPPSSGMATHRHRDAFDAFMAHARHAGEQRLALKIVCFDALDLAWAKRLLRDFPTIPAYLSAGTPVGAPAPTSEPELKLAVAERYRWLCEAVANDQDLNARVLPQLHVIAWGSSTGV
jgi:7-carboxy-7-deazaguanine synthase